MAESGTFDTGIVASFGFEFDNTVIKALDEVSGITMENEVVELKQNTPQGKYVNTFVPGRPKSGELTIKRGIANDRSLYDWMTKTNLGDTKTARRSGSVIAYDQAGTELFRYVFTNCMAKKYEAPGMKAGDNALTTESLVLTYDAVEMQAK